MFQTYKFCAKIGEEAKNWSNGKEHAVFILIKSFDQTFSKVCRRRPRDRQDGLKGSFHCSLAHPADARSGLTGRRGFMPVRSDPPTSPVPHGHPKNDAAPCEKHLRDTRGTLDGQKKRKKRA